MRKNYRKKIFSFLLICITLSSIPSIQEVGVSATPTSPFSLNSPSSSEFDTIDSFDVHPLNRWSITNNGYTAEVSDSLLNISDIGDNSQDTHSIIRPLRSLDGIIEIKYKFNVDNPTFSFQDSFVIYLCNSDASDFLFLDINSLKPNDVSEGFLRYDDLDNVVRSITLDTDEIPIANTWYVLRFDYDILKSNIRIRNYFNNDTKTFDYTLNDWSDYSDNRPNVLNIDSAYVRIYTKSLRDTVKSSFYVDYVKAPFKERDWENTDIPADPQWLQNNWNLHVLEDDIDDSSGWILTIPSLDSVSGEITSEISNFANIGNDEYIHIFYYVYAVDADDGDLHAAVRLGLTQTKVAGSFYSQVTVQMDGITIYDTFVISSTDPKVIFSISLENDRSIISIGGRYYVDRDDNSDPEVYDFAGSEAISNIATDPSQEFVLQTNIIANYDGDFDYTMMFASHNIVERGEFSGKGTPVVPDRPEGGGLFGWLAGIFITLIRALGVFLMPAFLVLDESIRAIQGWLNTLASNIWIAMGDALDFITDAIALIEGWLNSAIGLIQAWIEAIITNFIAGAQDLMEAIILGLINLFQDVWNFIVGAIFFFYDLLGWPDLLAIVGVGIESIIEILLGAPAFILSVINEWILPFVIIIICLYWFWVLFLSFAEEGFEPFSGFSNFFDRVTVVYNFTILGVGPLPIPIGLFFIPMTYFLIVVPAGSIFAIW